MSELEDTSSSHRNVGFEEAVILGINNFFQFNGRSSRGAYWFWWSAMLAVGIVAWILDSTFFSETTNSHEATGPIVGITALVTFIPSLAVFVRRMHDTGRSGWWYLIVFTIIGAIPVFIWLSEPGERGENRYGPDTETGRNHKVPIKQFINHAQKRLRLFAKERPIVLGKYVAITFSFLVLVFPPWSVYGNLNGLAVKVESGHHFLFAGPQWADIDYRKMFFIVALIWIIYAVIVMVVRNKRSP